tara:strand:+ start:178 stop:423 length:246 start_codon:yes stop_codon:yes gene_type:complete
MSEPKIDIMEENKNNGVISMEIDRYNKHMDEILEVKARLLEENIEDYDPNDPEQEAENNAIYEVFSKYYPDIYDVEWLGDE